MLVRTGIYQLSEPLTFGPEDGGDRCETNLPSGAFEYHKLKDYFVTYTAYPGERPILCGGTEIEPWIEEEGLWTATVDGVQVDDLVVEGQVQKLARTPNEGYYTAFETPSSAEAFRFQPGEWFFDLKKTV